MQVDSYNNFIIGGQIAYFFRGRISIISNLSKKDQLIQQIRFDILG